MNINELKNMPEDKLTEHIVLKFLKDNGPSSEETIKMALDELMGYLSGAMLLESFSNGELRAKFNEEQRVLTFEVA